MSLELNAENVKKVFSPLLKRDPDKLLTIINAVVNTALKGECELCEEIKSKLQLFDWSKKAKSDIFGELYEEFIERPKRYKEGEYYTPQWVINLTLDRIDVKDKVVLDPSCGNGKFLVSVFYRKVELGEDPDKALDEIIGIDINPVAVEIAKAELLLAYYYLTGKTPRKIPVYVDDFLLSDVKAEVVVTNPPWLTINALPKERKEYVKRVVKDLKLPKGAIWKGDISAIFLDKILSILPKGGKVGIVLPAWQSYSGFSTSHGAGKLLTYKVMEKWKVEGEIIYLGDVFKHGVPASLVILRKGDRFDVRCKSWKGKVIDDNLTFEEYIKNVVDYFKERAKLNGVRGIHLEGNIISPTFNGGPTETTRKNVIPLTFTMNSDVEISPMGFSRSVTVQDLKFYWYIPLKVIYPFSVVRVFKILTEETLKTAYREWEELTTTLSVLKMPKRPTITCHDLTNLVVYRNQRSFVSAVITKETLEEMCKYSNGLFLDHHVVYLEVDDLNVAYYYSAVLNYMVYKVKEFELGVMNRDQFGRPLKALVEARLEWRGEDWQKEVSLLSRHIMFRDKVLSMLGLSEDLPLFEVIDKGEDERVNNSLGLKVEKVMKKLTEEEEFMKIVRILDEKVVNLRDVLLRNVVEYSNRLVNPTQ